MTHNSPSHAPLELARRDDGSWLLPVRLQPKARHEGILGTHNGALKVAVTAPPEKGKANAALCKLLAKQLGISPSQVALLAGETSRDKRLALAGEWSETELRTLLLENP